MSHDNARQGQGGSDLPAATSSIPSFTPLYDRVIVKRDDAPDYKGTIIIPDVAKEKMQRGEVIAAGVGRVSDLTNDIRPMSVKPGDRVIFGKFTGDPIEIDGVEYLMMREDHIYGIIHDDAPPTKK